MKQFFIENALALLSMLFGGGSFWAYLTERKKRRIEQKELEANALKTMQSAYDTFAKDMQERMNIMRTEINYLNEKVTALTKELDFERDKYRELQKKVSAIKSEKSSNSNRSS